LANKYPAGRESLVNDCLVKMFGLLSSLDATKWKNSDKPPPADKETIEAGAYENYGVMDTEKRADCQKYVLVPDKGDPCKGFLYHYNSDPLRGVSSCWFSFGKGDIIKGMVLEDDWVVMQEDCLAELEANVVEDDAPPDLGLLFDLVTDKWTRKGSPPGGKAKLGYVEYDIRQTNKLEENEIEVQVAKKTGQESSVKMINVAWWNCFRSNPSVWLKLNKGLIVGVMTKDDWIIMAK